MENTAKKITLDNYVLEKELGSGANARVYLGHSVGNENYKQAVKVVNTESAMSFNENLQAIMTEAELLQAINHPNIIKFYKMEHNGTLSIRGNVQPEKQFYCILQFAEKGVMLDYLMSGGQLSEPIARYYFKQLIGALEHIHNKNVAHRDLKPDNLFLGTGFELLVADFGHAKQHKGALKSKLGTPVYNAPEVAASQAYDPAPVDVFMAGVVLFIFLTANTPFKDGATKSDPFYKHFISGNPAQFWAFHKQRLRDVDFNSDLVDLLTKMLAYHPGDRPSIAAIKEHPWYKGPTAPDAEVRAEMEERFQAEQEAKAEQERAAQARRQAVDNRRQGGAHGQHHRDVKVQGKDINDLIKKSDDEKKVRDQVNNISFKEEPPVACQEGSTHFKNYYSALKPAELLKVATIVANEESSDVILNVDYYEVEAKIATQNDAVVVIMKAFKGEGDISVLEFHQGYGTFVDFNDKVTVIKEKIEEMENAILEIPEDMEA